MSSKALKDKVARYVVAVVSTSFAGSTLLDSHVEPINSILPALAEPPVATVAEARPWNQDDIKVIVKNEVQVETRHWLTTTANREIRARFSQAADEEVDAVRSKVRQIVRKEVEKQVERQVESLLSNSETMTNLLERQLTQVSWAVEEKTREVLQRLVEEEKYGDIDKALQQRLEKKVDIRINQATSYLLLTNALLVGSLVAWVLLAKH